MMILAPSKTRCRGGLCCAVLLAAGVPQITQAANACASAQREHLIPRFVADMRRKDFDAVLSLYTPGAAFFDPDGSVYRGRAELASLYRKTFAAYDSRLTFAPASVEASVDPEGKPACLERGAWKESLRVRATGKVMTIHGAYEFAARLEPDVGWRFVSQKWVVSDGDR